MAFVLHSVQNSQRLSYFAFNSSAWKFSQSKFQKLTQLRSFMYSHCKLKYEDSLKDSSDSFQESPCNANIKTNEDASKSKIFPFLSDCDQFGNLKLPLEKLKKSGKKGIWHSKNLVSKLNQAQSRKSVLAKMKESDKFGNISDDNHTFCHHLTEQEEDGDDSTLVMPVEKLYRDAQACLKQMKLRVGDRKIKEALELFDYMKENRIKPTKPIYTFMIGACGRVGYTEMAFKLLRQMGDRGFRPSPATLTGLFNSCAESPFPEYGLKQAIFLKEKIELKNWQLTQISYHAMIKAFGRCGDLKTAFQVVDEMVEAGIRVTNTTYNFLLMSCISDKKAGFTHAVQVWRKMISKRLYPNGFSYNLLLRACRDCDVGPKEISSLLLQNWSSYTKRPYGFQNITSSEDILLLSNPETKKIEGDKKSDLNADTFKNESHPHVRNISCESLTPMPEKQDTSITDFKSLVPCNLLNKRPSRGSPIVELATIKTASNRLALLGGADGFLQTMIKYKIQPDIKTFSLLLECLPSDKTSEDYLMSSLEKYNVKPDPDFFNLLIKKRNVRKDYSLGIDTLLLINQYGLSPDIVTYGVISMACKKRKQGTRLLKDMKRLGLYPNIEIIGALVRNASRNMDFMYLIDLLEVLEMGSIKPDERILANMEEVVTRARKIIIAKENGKECEMNISQTFIQDYQQFSDYYTRWLQNTHMEVPEHPWLQYKTDQMQSFVSQ